MLAKTHAAAAPLTRAEVEDFLYHEAALLDAWELDQWLGLFTEDAQYLVPAANLPMDATAENSLYYIADERFRLEQRIVRLKKKTGHSEWPRSRTRHLVSNVRILEQNGDTLVCEAAFMTIRTRDGRTDQYWGSARHELLRTEDGLRIRSKKCTLDIDSLYEQGRITILL